MKSIAYRGELTATSELGRGSRFVFTVPVVAAPAERPTERIEAELSVVDAWRGLGLSGLQDFRACAYHDES